MIRQRASTGGLRDNCERKSPIRFFKELLRKTSSKLKQFAEEALSSEDCIEELFDESAGEDTNPSATTTDDKLHATMSESRAMTAKDNEVVWERFDLEKTMAQYRVPDQPFVQGPQVWEERRKHWVHASADQKNGLHNRRQEHGLDISGDLYYAVYKNLIEKEKPLKRPLNLQEAMKVVNVGWMETKKWERAASGVA